MKVIKDKIENSKLTIGNAITVSVVSVVAIALLAISLIYYATFNNTTAKLIKSQSIEINKQIILNYENYIDSLIDTANYIQSVLSEEDIEENKAGVNQAFISATKIQSDIEDIRLYDLQGNRIEINTVPNKFEENVFERSWFYEALENREIFNFSSPHIKKTLSGSEETVISLSKYVGFEKDDDKDGSSFYQALKGNTLERDPLYWHYPHYGNQGGSPYSSIIDGDYKLILHYENDNVELFNIREDIGEKNEISEINSEKTLKMTVMLKNWLDESGAKIPAKNPNWQ